MTEIEATVSWWSRKGKAAKVSSVAELDQIIDGVIESECKEYPTVVEIERLGYLFSMAVGLPESFVQIASDTNSLPYLVAVITHGADKPDTFNFYFQGLHHTEIHRRNILPISRARELARTFLITGTIPEGMEWEEL